MKMAMIGAADIEFQEKVNNWLSGNPSAQIHHTALALTGERWFTLLIFYEAETSTAQEAET